MHWQLRPPAVGTLVDLELDIFVDKNSVRAKCVPSRAAGPAARPQASWLKTCPNAPQKGRRQSVMVIFSKQILGRRWCCRG
jgi:hypothetical protein